MSCELTFLGHSAFLISDGSCTVAIDPFLTGNPSAAMSAADVTCTHVALTHGHEDHFGDTIDIAKANDATVVASYEITNYVASQGHEAVEPGNPGGRIDLGDGCWIAFTQAFHSSSFQGQYMGMPCGLMVHVGGKTIYHAGDTALFGDMKLLGQLYTPAVAILPIGDRFTMGPHQAAMAADMIGAPVAVPCHYGTWPPIEVDVDEFAPTAASVRVLEPGGSMVVD